MSIATAERKVQRCKDRLRIAYEELYAERARERKQEGTSLGKALEAAEEKMERFCVDYLSSHSDEYGLWKLPLRYRFIMCALATGMSRAEIAAAMPKISGKGRFVKMGVTTSRLHNAIQEARYMLYRIRPPKLVVAP